MQRTVSVLAHVRIFVKGDGSTQTANADNMRVQVGVVFTPLVTYENPPTYFRTNKVTYAFQEIVRADTLTLP